MKTCRLGLHFLCHRRDQNVRPTDIGGEYRRSWGSLLFMTSLVMRFRDSQLRCALFITAPLGHASNHTFQPCRRHTPYNSSTNIGNSSNTLLMGGLSSDCQSGRYAFSYFSSLRSDPLVGPLSGMTIALKENISYSYAPTTCSSTILKDYKPPFDATCVSSLIAAGAQIVGTTKMDEFGMG